MGYKFNPFTGNFDDFNGPDGEFTSIDVTGDITLDDGGSFTTTLQTITPTAARTISFPDATGTVGLVGGSSGNLVVNQSGAYAGVANSSVDNATGNITLGSRFISTVASASSAPAAYISGTWFAGTSSNALPALYVSPAGTAAGTSWATAGTGFGVNAPAAFAGNLLDLQVNGTPQVRISSTGAIAFQPATTNNLISPVAYANALLLQTDIEPLYVLPSRSAQVSPKFSFCHISNAGRTPGLNISSDHSLNWNDGTNVSTANADLRLFRDAANTLAQRNGTNAQAFRVYNTFTDASNYERGFLRWSSNVFEVGPEAAGTGTARPMRITAATLKLPNLPTYADNAAALAGSLVAGDVYKTATGELRITV